MEHKYIHLYSYVFLGYLLGILAKVLMPWLGGTWFDGKAGWNKHGEVSYTP